MRRTLLLSLLSIFAFSMAHAQETTTWDFGNDEANWPLISGYKTGTYNGLGLYTNSKNDMTNVGATNASASEWEDGYTSANRFQLNGGGYSSGKFSTTPTQRYLHFEVNGDSEVKIWFRSGNSSTEGLIRTIYLTDGTNVIKEEGSLEGAPAILEGSYKGGATTLYIYGDAACNLYKIEATNVKIEGGGGEPSETTETTWDFGTDVAKWPLGTGYPNSIVHNLGLYACAPDAETQVKNLGAITVNKSTWSDGYVSVNRFQLNGAGYGAATGFVATPTQRFVYFDVNGDSDVKIWFRGGSSTAGTFRTLFLTDGKNVIKEEKSVEGVAAILEGSYRGPAARLFIFDDAACNLYKITATNVGTTTEHTSGIDQITFTEDLYIEQGNLINNTGLSAEVYAVSGARLLSSSASSLSLNELPKGVYIVRVAGINAAIKFIR